MRIFIHPEYADAVDGFDGLMANDVLTYVVQGTTFVDEAYAENNFRSAKIRARGDRKNRRNRPETPTGRRSLEDFQLAYAAYKVYKGSAHMPSMPINPKPGLPSATEESKPKGDSAEGKWRAYGPNILLGRENTQF